MLWDGSGNPDVTDGLEVTQGQGFERKRGEEWEREGLGSEREWELGVWIEPSLGPESVAVIGSCHSYEQCIPSPRDSPRMPQLTAFMLS